MAVLKPFTSHQTQKKIKIAILIRNILLILRNEFKMRILLIIFLVTALAISSQAQKYRTAAGIRIGTEFGLTVQQLILENSTIEGIIQKGFFNDQTAITLLYEQHQKMVFKGLNFYIGAGPHVGIYDDKDRDGRKNSYGLSAIGGIEMRFGSLLASFDYKPAINFTGGERIFDSQTALSLRYIIIKAKKKEKNWKFWEKW